MRNWYLLLLHYPLELAEGLCRYPILSPGVSVENSVAARQLASKIPEVL